MRLGPGPTAQVAASWLGAGCLDRLSSGPSPEPGTLASTASPPATSACHFGRRALSWGYGGLTSLALRGKRGRGCRWTVAGGLRGEGVFTPGAGRRRRRFRSHLEAGGRSSEKRELLAPSLGQGGHAGPPRSPPRACPGLALRSPTFGLPRSRLCRPPPRGPQAIYYLKQLSSITREPAGPRREAPQETGTSFFFLALPSPAPTAATALVPSVQRPEAKWGPDSSSWRLGRAALVKPLWLLRPLREGCGPHTKAERCGRAPRPSPAAQKWLR